jgi:hypothetical protein
MNKTRATPMKSRSRFNLLIFLLYCVLVIMILFYLFIAFIFFILFFLSELQLNFFLYGLCSLLLNICIVIFTKNIKPLFVILITASFNYFIFGMCITIIESYHLLIGKLSTENIHVLLFDYYTFYTRIVFLTGNWLLPVIYLIWRTIVKIKNNPIFQFGNKEDFKWE